MNRAAIIRYLAAGYTLRLNEYGIIEAHPPERIQIQGIPSDPEETNPLNEESMEMYR